MTGARPPYRRGAGSEPTGQADTMGSRMQDPPGHRVAAGPDGRFADVGGMDVHYRLAGSDGPGVLLLHHFFGNAATWRHVLDGLSGDARALAYDRPGFGLTERVDPGAWDGDGDPYTRGAAVDIALALLDRHGIERAVVVGSSSGATIALELFARARERVGALVLMAPAITGDIGPPDTLRPLLRRAAALVGPIVRRRARGITPERVSRGWYDPSRASEADAEAYRAPMQVPGWEAGLWYVMTAEPRPDLRHVLPTVDVPTLVVSGSHDRTIRPHWSRRTAAAIPTARYVELDGVGHTPQEEAPERLLVVLREFVGAVG